MLAVEQHDAELLRRPRAEGRQQVRRRIARRPQLDARARRVRQRPPSELERRHDLRRLRARPMPATCGEIVRRSIAPGRAGRRARFSSSLATSSASLPRTSAAEHQRDELVVAERRRAVAQQLFARTIVGRQVFHRTTAQDRNAYTADDVVARVDRPASCSSSCVLLTFSSAAAANLRTRKCSRPRARSTPRAPPAPTSTRPRNSRPRRRRSSTPNDAVAQRDYRLALNHALDSRERAQNAAKMAADGKAAARVDADRALTAAAQTLAEATTQSKAAEAAKTSRARRAAPRRARRSTLHERQVQEARTAFERGDYLDATARGEGRNRANSRRR